MGGPSSLAGTFACGESFCVCVRWCERALDVCVCLRVCECGRCAAVLPACARRMRACAGAQTAWKWTSPLHFVDTPDWACVYDHVRRARALCDGFFDSADVPRRPPRNRCQATDCANDFCVVGAISNYSYRITTQTGEQQLQALKFLDHFCGDIHQPLHVSFLSNLGGNTITVRAGATPRTTCVRTHRSNVCVF